MGETPTGRGPVVSVARAGATAVVREKVRRGETREVRRRERLENDRLALELRLRRSTVRRELALRERYANWLLLLLVAQLLVTNAIFVAYAWAGRHWRLEPEVVHVWLGATVVQVVGGVGIVTRHLFPTRGQPADA